MRRARRPRLRGATTKAMPVSIVLGAKAPCDEAERRLTRARSDPRPARVGDRAPAPPAPEGLAGLRHPHYLKAIVPENQVGRQLELVQCQLEVLMNLWTVTEPGLLGKVGSGFDDDPQATAGYHFRRHRGN